MGAAIGKVASVIYVQLPIWINVFIVTCGHNVHKLIGINIHRIELVTVNYFCMDIIHHNKVKGRFRMGKRDELVIVEEPLYHDTWKLLKKYRDVVWSLELSVQQVRNKFEIEYGNTIEDFLDSVYLAGADIAGSDIEHHAQCIERSHRMLKLLDSAIDLLRNKHKNGESYYWLLYYSYLSPQQLRNVEEIIEKLRPHIRDISMRTYYRKRQECIGALSSILWGYTSKDSMEVLEQFVPGKQET